MIVDLLAPSAVLDNVAVDFHLGADRFFPRFDELVSQSRIEFPGLDIVLPLDLEYLPEFIFQCLVINRACHFYPVFYVPCHQVGR